MTDSANFDAWATPKTFDDYIANASHVLDNTAKDIPKVFFKGCSGVVLVRGTEGGFGLSAQHGCGVLIAHNDGKWSPPVAVSFGAVGAGGVIGVADKDMLIHLNHFGMKRFVEGQGHMGVGADLGFAVADVGGAAAGNIEVSDKGGWTTSFVFTSSKGMLINAEVVGSWIGSDAKMNLNYYGTREVKDIIEGKDAIVGKPVPENPKVTELLDRLAQLEA